jgi:signal transduction histidine kinase
MTTITPNPNLPTNLDFATDVKADRLEILWQVTLGVSLAVLLLMFTFVSTEALSPQVWVYMPLTMIIFCIATRLMLRYKFYNGASFTYTIGALIAISVGLTDTTHINAIQIIPFMYVLVIFMAGLLLRPSVTFIMATVASILVIAIPTMTYSFDILSAHQVIAILLIFIGALMAAQVTGELYQVTEWALENYQRERSSNRELFERREELSKTLKRAEILSENLQETNQELEEAKTAAEAAKNFRGQFLANMSHELRTPLNAIIGFSETMLKFPMMYDDSELPEAYRADLTQINTSGQQLLSLINDILDLARVDAGKLEIYMEHVKLRPILDGVVATVNGLIANKNIELMLDLPDTLPDVWADANRVRQVLLNLYSNSAKFTDSGSITLAIREVAEGVQFSVTDTGVGIQEDQMQAIFEEFRQASNTGGRDPRSGSGLGLAISRQLLDLMNGRIWAESVYGRGSTFHFILQAYEKDVITQEASAIIHEEGASAIIPEPSSTETSESTQGAIT